MSRTLIPTLIGKDLYFTRFLLIGGLLLGVISAVASTFGRVAFYVGSVTLLCVLIILNIFVVSLSVLSERKDKTLLFILSLPVSTAQYVRSKLLFNAVAFVGPWLLLLAVSIGVMASGALPFGLLPLTVLVFSWVLLYYCVFLAVALVIESTGWTTTIIIVGNISINFVITYLMTQDSVAGHLGGRVAVWTPQLIGFLAAELIGSLLALGLGCYFAARKRDFL